MVAVQNHRLGSLLANGVTSEIWSAVRLGPGGFTQDVALKTLAPYHARSPTHVRAFLHEARAAAHVRHPNVVSTHELLDVDGRYWLSMERIVGWPLRAIGATLALTRRRLPFEVAVAIVRDAAAGAHAIHEAGLVHRHLTPENLMVAAAGHAVVIDFGCASWELTEQVRFTAPLDPLEPAYASPQMLAHQRVDRRTDVYSLGAILFELCTGEAPPSVPGRSALGVRGQGWRVGLPIGLDHVLERALDPDLPGRCESAADLADALDRVAGRHRWHVPRSQLGGYLQAVFSGRRPAASTPPPPPPSRPPPPPSPRPRADAIEQAPTKQHRAHRPTPSGLHDASAMRAQANPRPPTDRVKTRVRVVRKRA